MHYWLSKLGVFYITKYLSSIEFLKVAFFLIVLLWKPKIPRCAFIKFLRLDVPYVLRCDADITAKDSIGTREGIFPLVSLSLFLSLSLSYKYRLNGPFTLLLHSFTPLALLLNSLVPSQMPRASPIEENFLLCVSLYKPFHLLFLLLFFSPCPFLLGLLSFPFTVLVPLTLL